MTYDHDVVEQTYEEDSLSLSLDILTKQCSNAGKFSASLTMEISDLKSELARLDQSIHQREAEVTALKLESKEFPLPAAIAYGTGDFFHRLAAWELRAAVSRGSLEGSQAVVRILNDEIRAGERNKANLSQQLRQLESQTPDAAQVAAEIWDLRVAPTAPRMAQPLTGSVTRFKKRRLICAEIRNCRLRIQSHAYLSHNGCEHESTPRTGEDK
jgi:hypothetical protein